MSKIVNAQSETGSSLSESARKQQVVFFPNGINLFRDTSCCDTNLQVSLNYTLSLPESEILSNPPVGLAGGVGRVAESDLAGRGRRHRHRQQGREEHAVEVVGFTCHEKRDQKMWRNCAAGGVLTAAIARKLSREAAQQLAGPVGFLTGLWERTTCTTWRGGAESLWRPIFVRENTVSLSDKNCRPTLLTVISTK